MPGVMGITSNKEDISSCAYSKKPYKLVSTELNNGDCSLMVERVFVVRKTRVQFSPFTLFSRRITWQL